MKLGQLARAGNPGWLKVCFLLFALYSQGGISHQQDCL